MKKEIGRLTTARESKAGQLELAKQERFTGDKVKSMKIKKKGNKSDKEIADFTVDYLEIHEDPSDYEPLSSITYKGNMIHVYFRLNTKQSYFLSYKETRELITLVKVIYSDELSDYLGEVSNVSYDYFEEGYWVVKDKWYKKSKPLSLEESIPYVEDVVVSKAKSSIDRSFYSLSLLEEDKKITTDLAMAFKREKTNQKEAL